MQIASYNTDTLSSFSEALLNGKTIVYPTETCYGLGCDATNQAAVDRIFDIKQRQRQKSLLVVVHDMAVMLEHVYESPTLFAIAETYWPGPLTVVVPARPGSSLAAGVIAADGTVAFRVTEHPVSAALCQALGGPLVSTSANIASLGSPYESAHVREMFDGAPAQPDILIDAGPLPHKAPSTIIKIVGEEVQVIRQGDIVFS